MHVACRKTSLASLESLKPGRRACASRQSEMQSVCAADRAVASCEAVKPGRTLQAGSYLSWCVCCTQLDCPTSCCLLCSLRL
jgi:hypothetical protein